MIQKFLIFQKKGNHSTDKIETKEDGVREEFSDSSDIHNLPSDFLLKAEDSWLTEYNNNSTELWRLSWEGSLEVDVSSVVSMTSISIPIVLMTVISVAFGFHCLDHFI